MHRLYAYLLSYVVASVAFTACDVYEAVHEPAESGPVALNMSKASGMKLLSAPGDPEYALRLWTDKIENSWGNVLNVSGTAPGAGDVDYYRFGLNDYHVMKDGAPMNYPTDNSPVYALGYYPLSKLVSSQTSGADDYRSFTLKTTNGGTKDWLTQPGLVDFCTTDIEKGTETRPFTISADNELQFRHTQVKLNFRYYRGQNLNGRVAQIWVTLKPEHFADKWVLKEPDGYFPENDPDADGQLIFSSTEDWYMSSPKPDGYDLFYSYFTDPSKPGEYSVTTLKDCYVLPPEAYGPSETSMFSANEVNGVQNVSHVTFQINAVVISSEINIGNRVINQVVTVPLMKDDDSGRPQLWTDTVKAGDAFTISITIDQNRLSLWAQKEKWEEGGWLTIPLNPNNPDEH